MEDEAAETAEGVRFAHLAVQLEPNNSIVLTEAAFGLGHLNRDLATAIPWFDRAIALNPNSAMALAGVRSCGISRVITSRPLNTPIGQCV